MEGDGLSTTEVLQKILELIKSVPNYEDKLAIMAYLNTKFR